MSRDPIGEAGGMNLYGYVGNNPVSLSDPLGLMFGSAGRPEFYMAMAWASGTGVVSGAAFGAGGYALTSECPTMGGMASAAGFGAVSGGAAGALLVAGGPVIASVLGGGALGGSGAGALAFGGGNAIAQGAWMAGGGQEDFSYSSLAFSAILGGVSGSIFFRPSVATNQSVISWARPGTTPDLNLGRWVMTGGNSLRNWLMSGVRGRGYDRAAGATGTIPGSKLGIPTTPGQSWESMWFLFGQRQIR